MPLGTFHQRSKGNRSEFIICPDASSGVFEALQNTLETPWETP
jgi:hypothetical protein